MAVKPTDGHIDWITDDDPAKYIAPSAAKKLQGWVQQEKPPYQYFNWYWRLVDRWLKWADAQSDENIAAIAAEATARANADTTLQGNIEAEATARADADTAHANETSVHGAVSAATASRIILRDADGRAKVSAPAASDDIARLDTIEGALGVYNPSYETQNNTSAVSVTSSMTTMVNLTTLTGLHAGDVFFINVAIECTKGATAGNNRYIVAQPYGTGTVYFVGGPHAGFQIENYVAAGETDRQQFGGFVFVTGDGDVPLRLSGYSFGSNSSAVQYYNMISVTFIRKQ